MANLQTTKRQLRALSVRDLLDLDEYLHDQVDQKERAQRAKRAAKREVVPGSARAVGEWTMQLEYVKCGKECRTCTEGKGHGPYWYGYRTTGGRTISKYFGKNLPESNGPARRGRGRQTGARNVA